MLSSKEEVPEKVHKGKESTSKDEPSNHGRVVSSTWCRQARSHSKGPALSGGTVTTRNWRRKSERNGVTSDRLCK